MAIGVTAMANWEHCPAVERAAAEYGGHWVFRGTDAPLYRLYECLAAGGTVDDFAGRYDVDLESAVAALRYEAAEFRKDRLVRPDGPGVMAPIPLVAPTGDEIPDWNFCPAVERIAGKVSGAWVFTESRLPLEALFENLASGCTLAEFDEWYGMEPARQAAVLSYEAKALREEGLITYARSA